jgi:hypothetical protein
MPARRAQAHRQQDHFPGSQGRSTAGLQTACLFGSQPWRRGAYLPIPADKVSEKQQAPVLSGKVVNLSTEIVGKGLPFSLRHAPCAHICRDCLISELRGRGALPFSRFGQLVHRCHDWRLAERRGEDLDQDARPDVHPCFVVVGTATPFQSWFW